MRASVRLDHPSLLIPLVVAGLACGGKPDAKSQAEAEPGSAPAGEVEAGAGEGAPAPLPEAAVDPDAPKHPRSYCEQVRALQGTWTLATSVVGARSQAAVGTTGEYELAVTADECTAKAVLRRVGEAGKALKPEQVRQAEAELAAAERLGLPVAAVGTFAVSQGGGAQTFAFVVEGDRLFGYWHDAGPRWEATGASGVLSGARAEAKPADVGSIAAQPCPVRCVVACDSARRRADETFVQAELDACTSGCETPDAPATCGEAKPFPESEILTMHGPVSNLGQACNALLDRALEATQVHSDELEFGCTSTIEFGGKKSPKLGKAELDGSFEVARFFESGHEYQGHNTVVRLAVMTKAGWYVSDPVLDSSSGGLVEHAFDRLDLYARDVADAPGKEVVAVLANHVTQPIPEQGKAQLDEFEMTAMCRAGEGEQPAPHCAVLRTRLRHVVQKTEGEAAKPETDDEKRLDLAFLPGGRVSISAGKGGASKDPLVGIWAW